MSADMNLKEKTETSISDDLTTKAARFGAFGWVVAFLFALALIAQNLVYAIFPRPALATQDGVVVGQVVFDEARTRANDQVLGDIKQWVAKCTSVNKITIFEDLAICLNHLSPELANERLKNMEKTLYATRIEKHGCKDTDITFDESQTKFEREPNDYIAKATLAGQVSCIIPNSEPATQDFKLFAAVKLTERTNHLAYAFKVIDTWDVIE